MEINTNELTNNWFDKQAQSFEVNRFGAMALMMTAQSCCNSSEQSSLMP